MVMRHLFAIALISITLAFPAFAQHGGAHGGFSGHAGGGFGGVHSGGFGGVHSGGFGGMHSGGFGGPGGFRPVGGPRTFASPPPRYSWNRTVRSAPNFVGANRASSYPYGRSGNGRSDHFNHRHGFGYRPQFYANSTYLVGSPFWPYSGYPGYPGFLDDWNDDPPAGNGTVAPYADPNANQGNNGPANYGQQPDENAYAAPQPPPGREPYRGAYSAVEQKPQSVPDLPSVTLVFKDGSAPLQIHNYALTSSTLYVLDEHKRDIPLNQIDIAATQRANQEQGVEFKLPSATP